jgi:hypothetical protein
MDRFMHPGNGLVVPLLCGATILHFAFRQWGNNKPGTVTLPIAFSKSGRVFTQHNGSEFYQSKASSDLVLTSFNLNIEDNGPDANWFAVGV